MRWLDNGSFTFETSLCFRLLISCLTDAWPTEWLGKLRCHFQVRALGWLVSCAGFVVPSCVEEMNRRFIVTGNWPCCYYPVIDMYKNSSSIWLLALLRLFQLSSCLYNVCTRISIVLTLLLIWKVSSKYSRIKRWENINEHEILSLGPNELIESFILKEQVLGLSTALNLLNNWKYNL